MEDARGQEADRDGAGTGRARSTQSSAPDPGSDGRGRTRPGSPGHGGPHHRRLHGRRSVFHLSAPRHRRHGAVRHGGSGARRRARDPDEARRGSGGGDRPPRPTPEPVGSPAAPGLLLPPGNGGRSVPRLPRRAAAPRRSHRRGPGGAEPHGKGLWRGRGRGPADHRHGALRNGRRRGTGGPGGAEGRRAGAAQARADEGRALCRGPGLRRGGAARGPRGTGAAAGR